MQPTPPLRPGTDVASALRTARERLGDRPAVTVLRSSPDAVQDDGRTPPERGAVVREEQGVASLAQWAAKGAHLVTAELLLEPGDALGLCAPLSWSTAAVCLAAWWAGVAIDLTCETEIAVVHERHPQPPASEQLLWLGDAIDGAPHTDVDGEAWVRAVQSFPDQPPAPQAAPEARALVAADGVWSQAALLARATELGEGVLGVDADRIDPVTGTIAVAVRPLVTDRATVVLHGLDRDAAAGERVATWWPERR